jgi:hypothetical protein
VRHRSGSCEGSLGLVGLEGVGPFSAPIRSATGSVSGAGAGGAGGLPSGFQRH